MVACFWLLVVPWLTCLAWRLAFVRALEEVPPLVRERLHVLGLATDCIQVRGGNAFFEEAPRARSGCRRAGAPTQPAPPTTPASRPKQIDSTIAPTRLQPSPHLWTQNPYLLLLQGSLLSIGIVFLNMGLSTLKDYLRGAIRSMEQQLMREAPPQPLPQQQVPLRERLRELQPPPLPQQLLDDMAAEAGVEAELLQPLLAPEQGGGGEAEERGGELAAAGEAAWAADGAAAAPAQAVQPAAAAAAAPHDQPQQQDEQQQQQEREQEQEQQAVVAAAAAEEEEVGLAPIPLLAPPHLAGGAWDVPAADEQDVWADLPFEELVGLQGPWANCECLDLKRPLDLCMCRHGDHCAGGDRAMLFTLAAAVCACPRGRRSLHQLHSI